jgi:putative oxidoreductase
MRGLGLLILRFAVATVFIAHGLPKVVPVWGGSPAAYAILLETEGLGSAYLVAVATGIVEVLGGVLLMAGGYTVWTSIVLAVTTATVTWALYLPHGFFLNWSLEPGVGHGYEFDLLRVSTLICLMLTGSGSLSFDGYRAREKQARRRKERRNPGRRK